MSPTSVIATNAVTMTTMSETFLLFEYNADGFHNGSIEISEETLPIVFRTIVATAKEEKRKVIITDVMDMCVFHMEDGKIIFPTAE